MRPKIDGSKNEPKTRDDHGLRRDGSGVNPARCGDEDDRSESRDEAATALLYEVIESSRSHAGDEQPPDARGGEQVVDVHFAADLGDPPRQEAGPDTKRRKLRVDAARGRGDRDTWPGVGEGSRKRHRVDDGMDSPLLVERRARQRRGGQGSEKPGNQDEQAEPGGPPRCARLLSAFHGGAGYTKDFAENFFGKVRTG